MNGGDNLKKKKSKHGFCNGMKVVVEQVDYGRYKSKYPPYGDCNFILGMGRYIGKTIEIEEVYEDRVYANGYYWLFDWIRKDTATLG